MGFQNSFTLPLKVPDETMNINLSVKGTVVVTLQFLNVWIHTFLHYHYLKYLPVESYSKTNHGFDDKMNKKQNIQAGNQCIYSIFI